MDDQVGCLKCGSLKVSTNDVRLRGGTEEQLSFEFFVFLYLVSIPTIALGVLMIMQSALRPYGIAGTILASAVFFIANSMHRAWRKADVVTYHTCASCGYSRKDDDPLPAIGVGNAVFSEPSRDEPPAVQMEDHIFQIG